MTITKNNSIVGVHFMKPGKLLFSMALTGFLIVPMLAAADTPKETKPAMTVQKESPTDIENVWPELILRPVGVLSSAIGAGFFLATLPFAAIANIQEPHDAFDHTYEAFIKTPVRFTFVRPIGKYHVPIESK